MKYKWKRRINRIISLILCVSMFMPFCAQFAQVYATESETSEYADNLKCTATFNEAEWSNFIIAEEPIAYDGSEVEEQYLIDAKDIPDDVVVKIIDYYVDDQYCTLWYKIEAALGHELPEALGERVWIFQNWTDFDEDADSLIINPKEIPEGGAAIYDENGEIVDAITLPQYEKKEVEVVADLDGEIKYQWQIQYGEAEEDWADILGMETEVATLSYGLVASLLDDNHTVNIRCECKSGAQIVYSDVIPITLEWFSGENEVTVEQEFITSNGEVVIVTVSGNLPKDSEVVIEETDADDLEIEDNETITAAFDITILDADGNEWQPEEGESVEVTLPAVVCGLDMDDTYVIYHLHGDKTEILGPYTVTGDTITFVVDGFSVFAFALADETYTPESLYDYSDFLGMYAIFNEDLDPSETSLITLDVTPKEGWVTESVTYTLSEFENAKFVIEDYMVLKESYKGYNEKGEFVEFTPRTLWYQVSVLDGSIPEDGFEDGCWILQNYLNEEDMWDLDTLTLFEPEELEEPEDLFVAVKVDGEEVSEIEVGISKKVTVEAELNVASASNAYQWQIYIPATDLWVDIYKENEAKCTVNYGMVAKRLDSDGCAYIRCAVTTSEETLTSEEITVIIGEGEEAAANAVKNILNDLKQSNNKLQSSNPNVLEGKDLSVGKETSATDEKTSDQNVPESKVPADNANLDGDVLTNNDALSESEEVIVKEDQVDETEPAAEVDPTKTLALIDRVRIAARNIFTTTTASDSNAEENNQESENVEVENVDYGVSTAAADEPKIYNVVINYVFENGKSAYTAYTTTIGESAELHDPVTFPNVLGYLPYLENEQINGYTLDLKGSEMTGDFKMTVVYKPTLVEYTVIVFQQNVYDDNYTEVGTVTMEGLTGEKTVQIDLEYPGFYQLLHDTPKIAADGSTSVEVRYDRNYYLMTFNLGDGGYGMRPVYARYGTEVPLTDPTRPGYKFVDWCDSIGNKVTSPITIPAEDIELTARWTPADTKYTVVYWRENADKDADGTYGYSYWGSVIQESTSGTIVSGKDDVPESVTNATVGGTTVDEKDYFTYNDAMTDKNVVVKGDGSTVVNVYYTRNFYTIYFKGYGTCYLPEHKHSDGEDSTCNSALICTLEPHVHDESCNRTLTCGIPEHTAHTSECLRCTEKEHKEHTDACCSVVHVHTKECYTIYYGYNYSYNPVGSEYNGTVNGVQNPDDGCIYSYNSEYNRRYCIYISGKWYEYTVYGSSYNTGDIVQPTTRACPGIHVHNEGNCNCDIPIHEHTEECYTDAIHTHIESCYNYGCGKVSHIHGDACYSDCTLVEHTHGGTCKSNNTNNIVYVLTAKYDADISTLWPTYDMLLSHSTHFHDNDGNVENARDAKFRGWKIDGVTAEAVSKRFNMTADLCATNDSRSKNATAQYGASYTYRLYYMFESFDQTSGESEPTRKNYNGTYYDSEAAYYQELSYNQYNTSFGQKEIVGMTPVENGVEKEMQGGVICNWLYYKRSCYELKFQSIDTVVRTVDDIKYGASLVGYKDYIPAYPTSLETDVYEFGGWYTSPGCYDGTEFDFETGKMPNADFILYAKWKPVTYFVEFYDQQDGNKVGDTYEVLHGSKLNPEYIPGEDKVQNGVYEFNGWYYVDENGIEQRFDFANMVLTHDMVVYAKWTSNVLIKYKINYTDDKGTPIADSTEGSGLAGTTYTFNAKGGADLYSAYQTGYFPNTSSHSITLNIEAKDGLMEYTFVYTKKEAVLYTVYYLAETLKQGTDSDGFKTLKVKEKTYYIISETKTVPDNHNAVVTENFVTVAGYMPDAYQKSLIVVPDAENVIYFYYSVDEEHAYYKVSHYTKNLDGNSWTEHYTYEAQGIIDSIITMNPMDISGFTYNNTIEETLTSGKLTSEGLHLKLFYTRNAYPYKVVYTNQTSGDVLYESEAVEKLYGEVVAHTAPDFYADGDDQNVYKRTSDATKSINIRIDEGESAPTINILTFTYVERDVEINYKVVGPTGSGTVNSDREMVKIKSSDKALGSTAEVSSDKYVFVGWYTDEDCKYPVSSEWISNTTKITPVKPDSLWSESTDDPITFTYYAKFEYNFTSLTIEKSGYEEYKTLDVNQTFLFHITGEDVDLMVAVYGDNSRASTTITGLSVGKTYTVTEVSDWSWRYEPKSWTFTTDGKSEISGNNKVANITLGPTGNKIVMTNERKNAYWLDGDSYRVNVFTNS